MLDGLRARLRGLLRPDHAAHEMEEELEEHLARSSALYEQRGLDPAAARLAARRELGNVTVLAEDARDARGTRWLDDLRRDLRHGARALARTPGFSAVVLLTLSLGFGVNGAMLSVLRGAMHPMLVPQPQTWVEIPDLWSYAEYQYLRDSVRSLSTLIAWSEQSVLVGRDGDQRPPEEVTAQFVSDNYFASLGGRPARGRLFGADETAPPAGEPVVILSHRFWLRRFGLDSSVIGRSIRLGGGQAFTVIGVMPAGFTGQTLRAYDLWLPLGARQRLPGMDQQIRSLGDDSWFGAGGREFLGIAGRIAPGATMERVRTELALRVARIASARDSTRGRDVAAYARTAADASGIRSRGDFALAGLFVAAALSVLLIASVTVANLMLARAAARRREMGVRIALGASRSRVVRAWLAECFLLGGGAAVGGLLLGRMGVHAFVTSSSFQGMARGMVDLSSFLRMVAPDATVVGWLAVLSVVATLTFGLPPVLRATRDDPLTTIRDGVGGDRLRRMRLPLQSGLVASQVALTMMLLVACGMLVRGLLNATAIDPGFDRHEVIVLRPKLQLNGYDSLRARQFIDELQQRALTVPGVDAAARGNVPILNLAMATITTPAGEPNGTRTSGRFNAVSASFFSTLGVPIVRGRGFTAEEVRREAPVAVLSEATARALFPDREAIGQVVKIVPTVRGVSELSTSGSRPAPGLFENARVIGIAEDAQMSRLGTTDRRYAYVPGDYWDLMIRRDPNRAQAVDERLHALARAIDPDLVLEIRSLEDIIWHSSGWLETAAVMSLGAGVVSVLSMLMAVIGLFGLTAFAVEQRTREFGVRMALGARADAVVRMVALQSLRLVGVGAVFGFLGAVAAGGVLRGIVFGVGRVDPLTYGSVALLLAGVSFLACYLPARRVTRVGPMIALRTD